MLRGVLFVEVETTTHMLSDFGDLMTPNAELRELVCPNYDFSKGFSSVPLLVVQLTRFKCGGVCLDFAHDHHVADGVSGVHLLNSWSRLARQLDLPVLPLYDRSCFAPRNPPLVNFQHLEYQPPLPALIPKDLSGNTSATREGIFELSRRQIEALKEEAMGPKALSYKPSTYEVLASHVWRCACKARGLANNQDVKLNIPVTVRTRMKDPCLRKGYYGNATLVATCVAKAEEIMVKPLWHVANIIHEAIIKIDTDYVRSVVDYLEVNRLKSKPAARAPYSVCPNLSINSWGAFPFDDLDIGLSAPKFVRHGGIRFEGQTYFIPSTSKDGGMAIAIKLYTPHMPLFERYLNI